MRRLLHPFCHSLICALWVCSVTMPAWAQAPAVPVHAQGLSERLITVGLPDGRQQAGLYSTKAGAGAPSKLAVLLPGYPSVVRPVVDNGVMIDSRLTGNFLIRARRQLVDGPVASLVVDCHSASGDMCSSQYQSSVQRQLDVDALIAEVKRQAPTIEEVWLVGTSMGTLSSSFMPLHNPGGYAGAIHTAAITDPTARGSYRELAGFDYGKARTPQFFVHHRQDPCALTPYSGAVAIAERHRLPLVSVSGGGGFQGKACEAFTEHGFRGREKEVMHAIRTIMLNGRASQLDID